MINKEMMDQINQDYEQHLNHRLGLVGEALNNGNMEEAASLIRFSGNFGHCSQFLLKCFYDRFSDRELYPLIINVYVNDGYDFPKQLIMKAKKIRPEDRFEKPLEEEYGYEQFNDMPEGDIWTVYRATYNPIEKVKYDPSWTIDLGCAAWFANRPKRFDQEPMSLYKAKIKKADVIAYTDDRSEKEVIQYRSVYDIEQIYLSEDEMLAQIEERAKKGKARRQKLLGH